MARMKKSRWVHWVEDPTLKYARQGEELKRRGEVAHEQHDSRDVVKDVKVRCYDCAATNDPAGNGQADKI